MKEYTIQISNKVAKFYEDVATVTGRSPEIVIKMTLNKVVGIILRQLEKDKKAK